ncbi:hypothetical protein LTR64_005961 [Lithohypha guttulata]|uniref:uncharacterized protein n=1 Tax=Lithohypha guttulata TaxID=1690604 RepID=UPI002DE17F35|nr:hypothetical protein LTR51_002241 [Lithohypha guttulata]
MQFPKLSQLQSRFAVSLGGTILLLLIYLSLSKPSFAYAAELEVRTQSGYDYPILLDDLWTNEEYSEPGEGDEQDVEIWIKRAPEGVSSLPNNAPQNMNIESGVTQNWVFAKEDIEGPHGVKGVGLPSDVTVTGNMSDDGVRMELKRQSSTSIWITVNTCLQPALEDTNAIPQQLQLYYSTSPDIDKPGTGTGGIQVEFEGGYGIIELEVDNDVYVGISAPNTSDFSGLWNYEIAASNDAPYHYWSNETDLLFVDGDNHAALLVTPDLDNASSNVFQDWMSLSPAPYGMFAHDQKNLSIKGVSRSYCGLLHNAKLTANIPEILNNNVGTMTSRGIGGAPKEQFYISALNASSSYYGWLAMSGNSTAHGAGVIGGGGRVWSNVTFRTKASDNCALMYNLTFCSEVAYAVPSNPERYSPLDGLPDLAAVYDSYASQMYQYFNYSLQQIPCNTTASAQYSLARNCDHCASAYKQWLCAVTIPRCEDWDNNEDYLQPRNVAANFTNGTIPAWVLNPSSQDQILLNSVQSNSSRNAQIIDSVIEPGPYKEVLPCIDLCYDLVQSCPAALGFGCPQGKYQNQSYQVRDPDSGVLRCSYLGAAYYLNDGHKAKDSMMGNRMGWMSLLITVLVLVF